MDEKNFIKCLQCGGDIKPNPKTGIPTCIYCDTEYLSVVDEASYDLQDIVNRRQMREFIQAEELCKSLMAKQPECSEVYWQLLLSTLGVVYVQEDGKAKPTFFSYSYDERESIFENEYYKKAIEYAKTQDKKEFYQERAKELDSLLKEFFNLVAKESSYDIFISFKKTTVAIVDGEERIIDTDDYMKAKEIYEALKDDYKVFFSPVSIGEDTGIEGEKYEPRILKALQTAQAMILVGSKKEYIESQWVENEWRRYQYFIQKGNKKKQSLMLVYLRNLPSLPSALKSVQLPTFDMFKGSYLEELKEKLTFVKSTSSSKSGIGERKIKANFKGEDIKFNSGHDIARVEIKGDNGAESIQIIATEQRDVETAYNVLNNGDFQNALAIYDTVLAKNPNNSKAYIGRFCANLGVKNYESIKAKAYKAKEKDFQDFDQAIQCSYDKEFSWMLVDNLIEGLSQSVEWNNLKNLYSVVAKYVNKQRVGRVFEILSSHIDRYMQQGRCKICDEIFEDARMIFLQDNLDANIGFMRNYAMLLLRNKHFDYAQRYFEELALVRRGSEFYLNLLQCKLKTVDITKKVIILQPSSSEDSSQKRPSELELDEILERILICTGEKKNPAVAKILTQAVLHQIVYNEKNVKPFIEIFVSCYNQMNMNKEMEDFLLEVANRYIQLKNFKKAKLYYSEVLNRNENNSKAHWGLLKCKLKALDDNDIAKKNKSLMKIQEFRNAMNCADNEEYKHYMSVYNGNMSKSSPNRLAYLTYTKKKRIAIRSAIAIVLVAVIGLIAFKVMGNIKEKQFYQQFSFVELDDGSYSVALAPDMTVSGVLEIPSIYKEKPVTIVEANAFNDCVDIKELIIPDSVTVIDKGAFKGCTRIYKITVGDGVTEIKEGAFANCYSLITLTLGKNVTSIEDGAFSSCEKLIELYNLSSVQISAEDENGIGAYLKDVYTSKESESKLTQDGDFWYYTEDEKTSLISYTGTSATVSLPEKDGELHIYANAFSDNDWITSITIPASLTSIGANAFEGCNKLKSVDYLGDLGKWCSVDFGNQYANPISITKGIKINKEIVEELIIPEGITEIKSYAFYNCTTAYSLTIPESIESIGISAFEGCAGLCTVKYNAIDCNKSQAINANVFYKAGNGIELTIGKNVKSIPDYLFGGSQFGSIYNQQDNAPNIWYITFEENSVCERIGNYAFYFSFYLEHVTLPDSVKYIGDGAFYQCATLTQINIPRNVTYIGKNAFAACSNVSKIKFNAIECDDLSSMTRPFTLVGENAGGCSVTFGAEVKRVPANLFNMAGVGRNSVTGVSFESGSVCTEIGENAFNSCQLYSLNIPQSVVLIEKQAFSNCSNLSSVTFEYTNGWFVTTNSEGTEGESVVIKSTQDAASKLTTDYKSYYWKR